MKKIIISILGALPLLAFAPKDSVSVEGLESEALKALKLHADELIQ